MINADFCSNKNCHINTPQDKASLKDLFQKYFKYDRNKCIIITGSFGKTTFAKLLKKELTKIGFKKNIIIAGRKNIPLFSLKENLNNFLIIEADYQNLSILKNSNFKVEEWKAFSTFGKSFFITKA